MILGTVLASAMISLANWLKTRREVVRTQERVEETQQEIKSIGYSINNGAVRNPIKDLTEAVRVLTQRIDDMGHTVTDSIMRAYPPEQYNTWSHDARGEQQDARGAEQDQRGEAQDSRGGSAHK